MSRQVALLRGINVGRNKRVGMVRLRELMNDLGYGDVRTHLQSGNVVFTATETPSEQTARHIEDQLAQRFGFTVPVLVRTRDELARIVEADPLREVVTDPARYIVTFLSAAPDPQRLPETNPADHDPDTYRLGDRAIYLWCPNGVRDSRLAQALSEKHLRVTATARNWNTVTKLLALASTADE